MMVTSYHNHTDWSDGKTGLKEMIAAAEKVGIEELGISDHLVFCPDDRQIDWTMKPEFLGEYIREIELAAKSSSIAILTGIEADYFPETAEILRSKLDGMPLDYVIGSVHYVGKFQLDSRMEDWSGFSQADLDGIWSAYWRLIRKMAESRLFDIVGHPDLPKKFAFFPSGPMTDEVDATLDSIAASGMTMELNTSGWSFPAGEAYPSFRILKAAKKRNIPIMINSDAHEPDHLTRNFQKAGSLAKEAGYSELARFKRRHRFFSPLKV